MLCPLQSIRMSELNRESSKHNNQTKCLGVKRLMLEARELQEPSEDFCARPLDENLFEWHFTLRGPPDTPYEGGYYHGRLLFPNDYPMKPPSIILLTPNGRFETNRKICLSISGHHPETWQPSWSVRTALIAFIAFMPSNSKGAIGSLEYSDAEKRNLAVKSRKWRCETCGLISSLINPTQIESCKTENICSMNERDHSKDESSNNQSCDQKSNIDYKCNFQSDAPTSKHKKTREIINNAHTNESKIEDNKSLNQSQIVGRNQFRDHSTQRLLTLSILGLILILLVLRRLATMFSEI